MSSTITPIAAAHRHLEYIPVALFGSVMGMSALSSAWHAAHLRFDAPLWPEKLFSTAAYCAFGAITVGYLVKWVTAPDAVRGEFRDPASSATFATFFTSLLLLSMTLAPSNLAVARTLWGIGSVGALCFAWMMLNRWIEQPQTLPQVTPLWLLPVVGVADIPLALPSVELPQLHAAMVIGLAIGLFFAIPLFTLIFARLLFEPPLPKAIRPSTLVLAAPFAVGFSTYVSTSGHVDLFAKSLYVMTLFVSLMLLTQLRHFPRCCPFRVAWWAVSFPLAAVAVAALRFSLYDSREIVAAIALLLLALATVVVAGLLVRTLLGVVRGEMRSLSRS